LQEPGCGPLNAAVLIGHTAGAKQFRSPASFALQSGTAPIPASSDQKTHHRLDRGGDRQLNGALHMIAIVRARVDPTTQAYLQRKTAEGKTKKAALRSLKRALARRLYHHLTRPPLPAPTPPNPPPTPPAR
jgi:transposase